MPNDIVDYVVALKDLHMDCIKTPKAVRRLNVKLTDKNIPLLHFILLRYADNKGNVKRYTSNSEIWNNYDFCQSVLAEKPPTGV